MTQEEASPYPIGTIVRFNTMDNWSNGAGYIEKIVLHDVIKGYYYNVRMFSDLYLFNRVHESLITAHPDVVCKVY